MRTGSAVRASPLTAVAAAFASTLVVGAAATPSTGGHFSLRGTVTRVADGDTIDVRLSSGKRERVRIIGVNTPERGDCYSARAREQTIAMTLRKPVGLVGDRTQARRDRSGRLLAYVSAPRRPDVGRRLLESGFARVLVVGRPFQRATSYREAERRARNAETGMWSACVPPPPAPPPPPPPPPPAPTNADVGASVSPAAARASIGQDVMLTVTVVNAGPSASRGVAVTANLSTLTLVALSASRGTCTTAPVALCDLGSVEPGSSATMTVTVRATAFGQTTATFQAAGGTTDRNLADNTATATITATPIGSPPPPPPAPAG